MQGQSLPELGSLLSQQRRPIPGTSDVQFRGRVEPSGIRATKTSKVPQTPNKESLKGHSVERVGVQKRIDILAALSASSCSEGKKTDPKYLGSQQELLLKGPSTCQRALLLGPETTKYT